MKLKSRKLTGGQAAIKSLRKEQVKHVFGLIGSATMEMFDAIYHDKKIKFIDVRDERTGTHMADGYARASNQPGVIIAGQNGPGATNLVTGLAQAKAAFSPVVSLAGLYSTKDKMEDAFQGLDQQSLFEPVTKKTITLKNSKNIPNAISDGFNVAMSPRRGPVCINLPRNLLAEKNNYKINEKIKSFKNTNNTQSNPNSIKRAAKLISNSSKGIIIVGGGIKYTSGFKPVIELAEYLNVPIVTAAGHGDAIPFNHKLNAGQMGPRGNPVATKLTKEADIILAIGTRLGFNSTFYSFENINKKAKIIQVELEKKMLGKYFPIKIGINADAATTANQLLKEFKKQKIKSEVKIWTERFKNERSKYLFQRNNIPSKNYPIQPPGLFKELRKVLPKNSAITLDAGTLCLQATDALEYYNPPSLFTPLDFGLVGFSYACGLGVKVAKPKRTVVSLMGDGGFGMTISELSTAVEHKINTITIVMNNKSWGAEKAYQKDFFGKRYLGADISSPPFSKVAELYGAKGYKVRKLSEINDAVKSALKVNKPVVIDVDVDPKALYSFRRDSFKHRSK
ncbi:thiamine pyrophosphate-binding protein [Candidatus Pelagibacter sp. RS40]|uniref:thiamine pyrophosphate-binding protein n=1 Tax=Candidatus Pelagibacter sp. RS40 TaxID=1977865 RepID=UPI000A169D6C|nr:thiamine pyrophosphate-binding protein [Candidatus Pelagibacter sp. RS40]ARJ49371.1 sulfoacetaldehyde acetyltransferase [Candidatus Pelagibacter sp. RS40]